MVYISVRVPDRIQILDLGLPSSDVGLLPNTGVTLSIGNAYMNLRGNWRVKYLRIMSAESIEFKNS